MGAYPDKVLVRLCQEDGQRRAIRKMEESYTVPPGKVEASSRPKPLVQKGPCCRRVSVFHGLLFCSVDEASENTYADTFQR